MQEEPKLTDINPYATPEAQLLPPEQSISWTASEYVAHHKTARWYILLAVSATLLAALIWLLTKDETSAAVVIIGAIVLGVYGARQPRELTYFLNPDVLSIASKRYKLEEFRSFTVDDQQPFTSINLFPLKRFAPSLSIYYDPNDENAILNILATRLPMEDHKPDLVDHLMRRIRF